MLLSRYLPDISLSSSLKKNFPSRVYLLHALEGSPLYSARLGYVCHGPHSQQEFITQAEDWEKKILEKKILLQKNSSHLSFLVSFADSS
jgi:hypothetical protein